MSDTTMTIWPRTPSDSPLSQAMCYVIHVLSDGSALSTAGLKVYVPTILRRSD